MTQSQIEKIIESIENHYVDSPVKQLQTFTVDEIKLLNRYKPNREKIYRDLNKLDNKTCFKVLKTIYDGFIYIEDDRDPIEPLARLYREAKKKIEKRIDKINKDLAEKDPYFENFPIIIDFKHHLDSPAKTGAPGLNRNVLVEIMSKYLSTCISGQADRANLIERILRFFYAVPKEEASARNIRSYCK